MRYREIIEAIENNDDEMFGSRGTSYAGWSAEDIKERYNELWEELYGYEAYWPDDDDEGETHSNEFKEKEQELDNLLHYVRIHWGEGFYNHLHRSVAARRNHDHSDREQRPEPPKDAFHDMRYRGDPRITKTGKLHKQDQQVLAKMVKSRVGTHRTPLLPESNDDDDMFSAPGTLATSAKQAIKQIEDPYLRTVRRVREIAKTKFGVKTRVSSVPKSATRGRATFWFGDYVTGPRGRAPKPLPVAQEIKAELERQGFECKVTGSGWLSVLVPPTYSNLLREENDDELFGSAPSANSLTQSIARAIVRSDKSARLITSPFMVGFALGKTPGGEHLLQYWKSIGQEKQDAMLDGINDAVYDLIANKVTEDDDDNDMFGTRPIPIHWNPELIADLLEQGQKVLMYRGIVSAPDILVSVFRTLKQQGDWMARRQSPPDARYTSNGTFHLDPNKYMLLKVDDAHMLISNLDWKEYRGKNLSENDDNDDDMFGSSTRPDSKVIAQDLELWLRRRQSSSRRPIIPSSENYVKQVIAAFNQNFLKGVETWREYPLYGNTDIKYDIREYLENSLNVNLMDYVDQVNENDESDDELFGDGKQKVYVVTAPDDEILGMFDDVREAIAHAKKQVPIYLEDGWADDDLITVYKQNWGEESGVPVAHFPITDDPIDENDESDEDLFAAPTIRFGDFFNEYDEDQLQALGFSYGDYPEQDVDIINHYLEDGPVSWRVLKLTGAEDGQGDNIVLHLDRLSRLG
jgi:hypothetical protein